MLADETMWAPPMSEKGEEEEEEAEERARSKLFVYNETSE